MEGQIYKGILGMIRKLFRIGLLSYLYRGIRRGKNQKRSSSAMEETGVPEVVLSVVMRR